MNYKQINKESWNQRVAPHVASDFYQMENFLQGATSLKEIELPLLADVSGERILHLQCHFGQDSLSLARMGAKVTGVDISDKAIDQARKLNDELGLDVTFICCDIYDLPDHLEGTFDRVFCSYGTIVWLPDMSRWADIISRYLKPGGAFVFIDFHPILEMYSADFSEVFYGYFNTEAFEEVDTGTYAEKDANIVLKTVTWNHSLSEVFMALIESGLSIKAFQEYDFSPYNCFQGMEQVSPERFQIKKFGNKIPMVYSLVCVKK